MERHEYKEVDDAILGAYRHVKETGAKVKSYNELDAAGNQATLGLESEDGHIFVISYMTHLVSQKRTLARQILTSGLSVAEFVNRQLIVWL